MAGPILWGPNGTSKNLQSNIADKIIAKTTTYTATGDDDFITADASGGAFTLSLPDVGDVPVGKRLTIKKIDSTFNIVTLDPFNPSTIGGLSLWTLGTEGESIEVTSDGTNWLVTSHEADTAWRSFSITVQGAGAITLDQGFWRRTGDSIEIKAIWTNGTVVASDSRFSLPTGLTTGSSWGGGIVVGVTFSGNVTGDNFRVIALPSSTYVNPIRNGFSPVLYNSVFNSSETEAVIFTVQITNWLSL